MRYLFLFLIIASISGAFGCASSSGSRNFVLLRHPLTNKTVECPGEVGTFNGTSAEMKACVDAYIEDGYKEIYSY
jgi:hypothetical protein